MRISDQIANWLVKHGLEQVFAVTGGGSMFLNQAFGKHNKLRCTFMHHEQACAMAAEGYARISGKPAIVMTTSGPGAINALNGVFGAYVDSIPMIVLSGQIKRETCRSFFDLPNLRQLGDQEGPIIDMAKPICKYAHLVKSEKDLEKSLLKAFSEAISGRPGPTWLDIPIDIQQSNFQIDIPNYVPVNIPKKKYISTAVREIIENLCRSHRPLIVGGTGIRLSNTQELLINMVESLGIPLCTAWTHDLIPSDHNLFAGRPGTIGTRAGNFCLQSCDFLIVLGSRLNIRQISYNWNTFAKNAWIAQVDIDDAELSKPTIDVDLGLECDLKDFFNILNEEIKNFKLPSFKPWAEWCLKIGEKYNVSKEHKQKLDKPLNPYVVVDRVFGQMRKNDIVVTGNASACILPFQVGFIKKNQRLFSNSGSASMGYDLPAALGASIATKFDSKSRVICFAGDGSIQMNIQELQTLKSNNLNVIIIVINNKGYLSIWQTHENFFGNVIGATPESGIEFPDFVSVASAYGIKTASIVTKSDLVKLDRLLQLNGPLLIDIHVDPRQVFLPRIKSRVNENGEIETPELDDMHPFLSKDELNSVRSEAKLIRAVL